MYLYLELWKPLPAWENLGMEQREDFLTQLDPGVKRMQNMKVELVAFAINEAEGLPYRYIAAWKMPNKGHIHMLEKAELVEGWANYFDITHIGGKILEVDQFTQDMVRM